jgi:hypothetical protein
MRIRKEELELQLPIMIAYLRLKLDQQDWHGVADAAMDILDTVMPNGAFPYGVCLGNHDFNIVSDKNSGSSVYDQFFGPARYAGVHSTPQLEAYIAKHGAADNWRG